MYISYWHYVFCCPCRMVPILSGLNTAISASLEFVTLEPIPFEFFIDLHDHNVVTWDIVKQVRRVSSPLKFQTSHSESCSFPLIFECAACHFEPGVRVTPLRIHVTQDYVVGCDGMRKISGGMETLLSSTFWPEIVHDHTWILIKVWEKTKT